MNQILSGAVVMAYMVAGLFFLRFWKRSSDSLFIYFAIAFWILAGQRLALAFTQERNEDDLVFYVVRLAAFILILVAIWNKNQSSKRGS
jgi:hypothetical protein